MTERGGCGDCGALDVWISNGRESGKREGERKGGQGQKQWSSWSHQKGTALLYWLSLKHMDGGAQPTLSARGITLRLEGDRCSFRKQTWVLLGFWTLDSRVSARSNEERGDGIIRLLNSTNQQCKKKKKCEGMWKAVVGWPKLTKGVQLCVAGPIIKGFLPSDVDPANWRVTLVGCFCLGLHSATCQNQLNGATWWEADPLWRTQLLEIITNTIM